MQPPLDLAGLNHADKDALILSQAELIARQAAAIETLSARVEVLVAQNAALMKRVEELEARIGAPPKTPDNSSTPPSRGQKACRGADAPLDYRVAVAPRNDGITVGAFHLVKDRLSIEIQPYGDTPRRFIFSHRVVRETPSSWAAFCICPSLSLSAPSMARLSAASRISASGLDGSVA